MNIDTNTTRLQFVMSTSAVLVIIHAESPVLSTAPLAWSPADSFTAIGCSTDAQQLFTGVAISAAVVTTAPAADDDCTADDDPSADAARTATRERCRAGTPSTVAGFPPRDLQHVELARLSGLRVEKTHVERSAS